MFELWNKKIYLFYKSWLHLNIVQILPSNAVFQKDFLIPISLQLDVVNLLILD